MKNLFYIFILALGFVSCGNDNQNKEEHSTETEIKTVKLTTEQYKNAEIQIGSVEKKNISSIIQANGKVNVPPQNLVSISVPMGGFLKHTKLLPGMSVKKGEVLAILEDQQYIQLQQDYLTAKTQLALDESEYKRQKQLNENKASSDKVYEQAKADYQSEYILFKSLEEKLKLIGLNPQKISADNISRSISIISPINGYVSLLNVNSGKYVNQNDVLFELINLNDLYISLTVFEKNIEKISVGQKIQASLNSNSEQKYDCSILFINQNVSNDNSVEVICKIDNKTNGLLPGMFVNAQIDLSNNEVNTLPEEAIVSFNNKQYVFIETSHQTFEMIPIKQGNTENGYSEVLTDLTNKKIVTKGAYTLLMALKNVSDD